MPAARRHDIDTSHEAARSVYKPSDVQHRIAAVLQGAAYAGDRDGLTDEEMIRRYKARAAAVGDPIPTDASLRSRRAELVVAGKVRRSLVNGKTATGRAAAKWVMTS
ncbi:hypothetical protein EDF51_106116 [Curtobacterium sp. PhB25]|uniref:hypothetical protein n=1 Tax=Curtobacterium sp. PhB25 TaxID=2485205 RepID=UPI001064F860|nr:hypothetical protein [Curtobacterium sp. PhB25]TDW69132.1 hypothetical protein EDF51_106116 [Curtobacterium sp. PhB25]